MVSLTGRNVVVIGGSRGVGRKIAEAAVAGGARVRRRGVRKSRRK